MCGVVLVMERGVRECVDVDFEEMGVHVGEGGRLDSPA